MCIRDSLGIEHADQPHIALSGHDLDAESLQGFVLKQSRLHMLGHVVVRDVADG